MEVELLHIHRLKTVSIYSKNTDKMIFRILWLLINFLRGPDYEPLMLLLLWMLVKVAAVGAVIMSRGSTHTHKFKCLIHERQCGVRPPRPSTHICDSRWWRAASGAGEGCTAMLPQMSPFRTKTCHSSTTEGISAQASSLLPLLENRCSSSARVWQQLGEVRSWLTVDDTGHAFNVAPARPRASPHYASFKAHLSANSEIEMFFWSWI